MKIVNSIILTFIGIILSGCAELIPTPKDQAAQIDFGAFYMESLAAKYKAKGEKEGPEFSQKLAKYDSLATYDADVEEKKQDAARRNKLNEEIRELNFEKSRIEGEISTAKSMKSLEERKAEANRKKLVVPNGQPPLADAQIQAITLAIESNEKRISEINSAIMEMESKKSYLSSRLEDNGGELSKLKNKIYNTSEALRITIRNEVIRDFIAIADHNYMYFKNDLLAGRVRSDTLADLSELLLSTATTLSGGVMSKTNLGAASTLVKGSRSTIEKNFFAQQTMRAIINAMEQGRSADKKIIVEKMAQSTSQYPLSEAISDVQRYQSRASLFLAVLDLANQSGNSAVKAESDLNEAVKESAKAK